MWILQGSNFGKFPFLLLFLREVGEQNIRSMLFVKKAGELAGKKAITHLKEYFELIKIKLCFLAKMNCSFCE